MVLLCLLVSNLHFVDRSKFLLESLNFFLVKDLHTVEQGTKTFCRWLFDEIFNALYDIRVLSVLLKTFSDHIVGTLDIKFEVLILLISHQDWHAASLTCEIHPAQNLEDLVIWVLRVSHLLDASIECHDWWLEASLARIRYKPKMALIVQNVTLLMLIRRFLLFM